MNTITTAPTIVADMLGTSVEYIHAHPYQRYILIETGVVIGYQHHRSGYWMKLLPDNCNRLPKWIHENDILRYAHPTHGQVRPEALEYSDEGEAV